MGGAMKKFELLNSVGLTIKTLRFERGWAQDTLAELADLHRNYVQKLENGETNIGLYNLSKIVGAFHLTLAEFFEFDRKLLSLRNEKKRPPLST
jgi:transcriptional regulator with XRE-family HTH domain